MVLKSTTILWAVDWHRLIGFVSLRSSHFVAISSEMTRDLHNTWAFVPHLTN